MEANRFDAIARGLDQPTARRRALLRLALGPLVAIFAARRAGEMEARKGRKKKRKKAKQPAPRLNQFGCLDVGQPCADQTKCCSGICDGPRGKGTCIAHDTRVCTADSNMCIAGQEPFCGVTNKNCACVVTTGNAPFCGDHTGFPESTRCRDCQQDADCQAEFGPEAACAVYTGLCSDLCPETGRACVPACNDG